MTKDKKNNKRAFADARGNLFLALPEDFVLITDETHPLYDPRVKKPLKPAFIKSIMKRGVIEPVVVRKEGDQRIVVNGRQRVRGAAEANRLLKEQGASDKELHKVPYVVRRPSDPEAMSIMVELNELSSADELSVKIDKMQRLLDRNLSEQEVADSFGVTLTTIKGWIKLRECHPKVRAAISDGRIRLADAVAKIAKLPRNAQPTAVDEIAEANPTRATRKARGEKARKTATPITRLKRLIKHRAALKDGIGAVLVDWLIGTVPQETLFASFPELRKEFE